VEIRQRSGVSLARRFLAVQSVLEATLRVVEVEPMEAVDAEWVGVDAADSGVRVGYEMQLAFAKPPKKHSCGRFRV
jgi:hypothetical protein